MIVSLKAALAKMLGEQALGALEYWRKPQLKASWGGPFNGQVARQELFSALIAKLKPQAIIETGTFRGTTTEFLASTGLPVFTIEGSKHQYGYARMRLAGRRNVKVLWGDSRQVLDRLFEAELRQRCNQVLFAYLDAHGSKDLPLARELEIIFGNCPSAVAMVDDFKVPFDAGYTYDDYGPGKALVPDYIEPAIAAQGLVALYPSTPSSEETGMKRGTVILAGDKIHGEALRSMPTLRDL